MITFDFASKWCLYMHGVCIQAWMGVIGEGMGVVRREKNRKWVVLSSCDR